MSFKSNRNSASGVSQPALRRGRLTLRRRRMATLAALTTGTCLQFGSGCIQTVLATIGATFF